MSELNDDCEYEYDAPAATLVDGTNAGEVVHSASATILVPMRPHYLRDGKWIYERYKRAGDGNYYSLGEAP